MAKKGKMNMEFVVDTSKPAKSIGELQKRVETLRNTIEGAPLGSAEFEKLTAQLQDANSQVKVLEKNMEGLEPQQKAEAFLKMGEGIAGGFLVAQGSMALMGIESENLEKLQVKIQSALAIAAGIRMMSEAALMVATAKRVAVEKAGVVVSKAKLILTKLTSVANWILTGSTTGATVAFSAQAVVLGVLRLAMLALPLVAIGAGIASVVSWLGSWFGSEEKKTDQTRESTTHYSDYNDELRRNRELLYDLSQAETETEKEMIKAQDAMDKRIKINDDLADSLNEMKDAHDDLVIAMRSIPADTREIIQSSKDNLSIYEAQLGFSQALETQYYNELNALKAKSAEETQAAQDKKDLEDEAARRSEARASARKTDAANLLKLEQELTLLLIKEDEKRGISEDEMREIKKNEIAKENDLASAAEIGNRQIRKETIQAIEDKYAQIEIDRLEKKHAEEQKLEEANKLELEAIEEAHNDEMREKTSAIIDEHYASLDMMLTATEKQMDKEAQLRLLDKKNADNDIIDKYFSLIEHAEEGSEERRLLEESQSRELKVVQDEFDQAELDAIDEKNALKKEKIDEITNASLDSIYNIADVWLQNLEARDQEWENQMNNELALAEGNEDAQEAIKDKFKEKRKKALKTQKKIQIAMAVIDTYKAASSAYSAMAVVPVVGPVLAPIAAAAALVAGFANIRKIKAQQIPDAGGDSGGGGSESSGAPKAAIPTTGAFTLGGADPEKKPIKAYVVTDEMTDSQDQLEDIRQESTL